MRRTKIVFLLWILCFLLIWLRHGSPAAALAGVFAVLYAILAFVLVRLSGRGLAIQVDCDDTVEKNAAMHADIRFLNKALFPVFLAEGKVRVANLLTGEEQGRPLAVSLWPKERRTETIEARTEYCGRIDMSMEEMTIYDPLKLFRRRIEVAGAGTGYVLPAIFDVEIPAEYMESFNMESYQYSQFEQGSDTGEVFGLREYQAGDSAKQIHWKLFAKMDEPVVKIPSYPIENNVLLLLDNLLIPEAEVSPSVRSNLMELFWSLSARLLENDMPHSVGWYDQQGQEFCLYEIKNRQDMWAAIPESLRCGFYCSEYSTVYRYIESMEGRGFSNHFLVTSQKGREIERLENYGAVKIFEESK